MTAIRLTWLIGGLHTEGRVETLHMCYDLAINCVDHLLIARNLARQLRIGWLNMKRANGTLSMRHHHTPKWAVSNCIEARINVVTTGNISTWNCYVNVTHGDEPSCIRLPSIFELRAAWIIGQWCLNEHHFRTKLRQSEVWDRWTGRVSCTCSYQESTMINSYEFVGDLAIRIYHARWVTRVFCRARQRWHDYWSKKHIWYCHDEVRLCTQFLRNGFYGALQGGTFGIDEQSWYGIVFRPPYDILSIWEAQWSRNELHRSCTRVTRSGRVMGRSLDGGIFDD